MRSLCSVTCVPPRLAAITGGDTGNAEELGVAERVSMHRLLMSRGCGTQMMRAFFGHNGNTVDGSTLATSSTTRVLQ